MFSCSSGISSWKDLSDTENSWLEPKNKELCIRSPIYNHYLKTVGKDGKEERERNSGRGKDWKRWERRYFWVHVT